MAKCFSIPYNKVKQRLDPEFYDPSSKWKNSLRFERYAISLIDALAKEEKKDFFANYKIKKNKRSMIFDGYAPMGISNINGPLIIEVKLSLRGLNDIKKLVEKFKIFKPVKNLLLITKEKKSYDLSELDINIEFWDYKDLKNLEDKFPEISYPITKDVSGAIKHWQNVNYDNNKHLLINELANTEDLVLFLGAGCSVEDKIPNWNKLLENLLFEIFNQHIEDKDTLKKLENLNIVNKNDKDFGNIKKRLYNSNLILGRFIKEILDQRLVEETQKSLYNEYKRKILGDSTLNGISDFIQNNNQTIKAVVTYNFDDLLEYYLDNRKIEHVSIFEGGKSHSNDQIPIYHIHGYLPKDDDINNDSVIFGEKEYHIQYGDPHSWQNMIPLKFLRENTVLFIGLSMEDPNLRRLLDIGYRYFNSPKHYLLYSKKRWESSDEKISNIFRGMEDRTFRDLGLKIIWLNDHDEINKVLNEITYKMGKRR